MELRYETRDGEGNDIVKMVQIEVDVDNFPNSVTIKDIKRVLRDIPAADVVEVVRCETCNQFRRYTKVNQNFGVCRRSKMEVSWHDFCSYGVKEAADER